MDVIFSLFSTHTHTHTHSHTFTGFGVWYMVVMFSECESDVLHSVSLQLSTLVWSLWFTSHPALLLYIDLRRTDGCLHLSHCLSPAERGPSFPPVCLHGDFFFLNLLFLIRFFADHESYEFKDRVETGKLIKISAASQNTLCT